ncbi:MAG TPA: M48 family metallopeptidase [Gemmatimonadales bacterium]|nr:M48 family metallopeptidase [Gemmatimonadales bacterium]
MDNARFRDLVVRLEQRAADRPAAYRAEVGGLAALGYVYVIGVLGLLIALLVGLIVLTASMRGGGGITGKLAIPIALVMYAIVRALWVRIPPPEGIPLTQAAAPKLFEALDEISAALKAPRFHDVLLTDDFNASVSQVPRLGVFGWQRNYLIVGLPLMQTLSADQFRAVLAHEMGHLSGNHSRFRGWIYRVRRTWGVMLHRLEARHSALGDLLFTRFVRWYAPFFNAYSFVLARSNEYEADRCSGEVAGAENAGAALLRLQVGNRFLNERYWPSVNRRVTESSEPPTNVYSALSAAVRDELPTQEIALWVDEAWRRPTDYADTHPSLADRLTALGVIREGSPRLAAWGQGEESAAAFYLGSREAGLTHQLERAWRDGVAPHWEARHRAIHEARQRLTELNTKAGAGVLNPEEQWERIGLTAEFDAEAAVPLAEALLDANAEHAGARMFVGRTLLERGDERGVRHLEVAMQATPHAVLPACDTLFDFYWTRGRRADAERFRKVGEEHAATLDAARVERTTPPKRADLRPHDLGRDVVERIRQALADYPLAEFYVVRRAVTHVPEIPCYLVGMVVRRPWYQFADQAKDVALRDRVMSEIGWPEETYGFLLDYSLKKLREVFRSVPNAKVIG